MVTELEAAGRIHPTADEWILHFGYATNPLPMNGSKANWRGRNKWTAAVKDQALKLATYARIPKMARCEAQLIWWVQTNTKRDVDNLALFEKPLFDALVLAGVVHDDTPEYMTKPRAEIRKVTDSNGLVSTAGFTLHVRRLEEVQA